MQVSCLGYADSFYQQGKGALEQIGVLTGRAFSHLKDFYEKVAELDTKKIKEVAAQALESAEEYIQAAAKTLGRSIGSLFWGLSEMRKDIDAFALLIKIARIVVLMLPAFGVSQGAANHIDGRLEKANSVGDGLQFFAVISSMLEEEEKTQKTPSIFERFTILMFSISSVASGLLLLLSMKIPVFGEEFSKSMSLVTFLSVIADGTAVKGFFSNALDAIVQFPDLATSEQWAAFLKVGEGVFVGLAITFGMVGMATLNPLAMIIVSILACGFGAAKFLHRRYLESIKNES